MLTLIADVIDSRNLPDRRQFQRTLSKVLSRINERASATLLSPYTITIGDEFQAVYSAPQELFEHIATILWRSHPAKIRFALNYGELTTDINPNSAMGMDGPAFYGARDLLERAKKHEATIIRIDGTHARFAALLDATLTIASNEITSWNETAIGAFTLLLRGTTVREMANHLPVKERAIYKSIETHHLKDFARLFTVLSNELAVTMASAEQSI